MQSKRITLENLWPNEPPDVEVDPHGWFLPQNAEVLSSLLSDNTKTVIELGSWLGQSTRHILSCAGNARVYAIDTWMGGPEHQGPNGACNEKLPTLYETFLINCWGFKDRLYPLRMTTLEGLDLIHSAGVVPDLIYVDADHTYESVIADIDKSLTLFPNAQIVGDDWGWGAEANFPVQRAAKDMAAKYNKSIDVRLNWAWCYK